ILRTPLEEALLPSSFLRRTKCVSEPISKIPFTSKKSDEVVYRRLTQSIAFAPSWLNAILRLSANVPSVHKFGD
ncbi:MAG: hypothetical protein MRY72_10790, partial [Aquisalinus sp.]|nr:hypothetical protein [Aquisalinus sp.]